METCFILRFSVQSAELADAICEQLDVDGPVFETEVLPQFRFVFRSLEEFFPPEFLSRINATTVELSWTAGSEIEEDLRDAIKALGNCGAREMAGYFWADEDEGFFVLNGSEVHPIDDWKKKVNALELEISDDDEWISLFLSHLQNEYFVSGV